MCPLCRPALGQASQPDPSSPVFAPSLPDPDPTAICRQR